MNAVIIQDQRLFIIPEKNLGAIQTRLPLFEKLMMDLILNQIPFLSKNDRPLYLSTPMLGDYTHIR